MVQKIEPCNFAFQIFMSINDRLKAERERLQLTQPRVAEALEVGKTTVINWEKGTSAPDAAQLARLAQLGADVLYIVVGHRSQVLAPAAALPREQQALLNSYEICSSTAKKHLLQTAALLASGAQSGQGAVNVQVRGDGNVAAGRDVGKRTKK